jgi:hypothetical protein
MGGRHKNFKDLMTWGRDISKTNFLKNRNSL